MAEKRARASAKRVLTCAISEAEALIAESNSEQVDLSKLKTLKEAFFTACNVYIDSLSVEDITDKIEDELSVHMETQCKLYTDVVYKCNKYRRPVAVDNVDVKPVDHISREELAAILTSAKVSIKFDGDPLDYHNFMLRHEQSVKFVPSTSAKLALLVESLSCQASKVIAGCSLLEDAGYETALKMLETNFGNREKIFGLVETKLLNGRTARTSDELLSFACDLRSAELSLRVMRKEADFTQRMIVEIVERRLTKGMVVQWRKYALDLKEKTMSYPSFSSFVDWMEKSARGASDPFYGYSDESSMPRKFSNVYNVAVRDQPRSSEPRAHMPRAAKPHYTPSAAESRAHMPRAAEPHHMLRAAQPYGKLRAAEPHHMPRAAQPYGMLRTTAEPRNMCPLCEQSHKVSSCDLFFNMNVSDRINYVQRNNICFNCLAVGHFVQNCRSQYRCGVCAKNHHSLLHIHRYHEGVSVSGAGVSHTLTKSSGAVLPLVGVGVGGIQTYALLDSGSNVSFVARSLVRRLGLSESPAYMKVGTIAGIEKKRTSTVSLTLEGEGTICMRGVFVTDVIAYQLHAI